jgi:intein-encoded DNA endonuclease-like protein
MNTETLYKRYKKGESIKDLAKEIGLTAGGLQYRLNAANFVLNKRGPSSSQTVNHFYFSNIDSEIKAYLLGFFAADGCIYNHVSSKNSWYLEINLQATDDYIVKLFQSEISPKHKLKYVKHTTRKNQVRYRIASKQIATDLMSLGFPPRKTHAQIRLPKIDSKLIPHFIRGFFDGDGSVGLYKTARGYYVRQFNIVCQCVEFLEELQSVLPVETFINPIVHKQACTIATSNWRSLIMLYDFLYKDANYFLFRKKERFKLAALTPSELIKLTSNQPCND